jgi:hypothetical protein
MNKWRDIKKEIYEYNALILRYMYIYLYICIYIYMCIHICIYIDIYVYIWSKDLYGTAVCSVPMKNYYILRAVCIFVSVYLCIHIYINMYIYDQGLVRGRCILGTYKYRNIWTKLRGINQEIYEYNVLILRYMYMYTCIYIYTHDQGPIRGRCILDTYKKELYFKGSGYIYTYLCKQI